MNASFPLFLLSIVLISLSGVMMPGPVTAVTVAKGYRDRKAGAFIALGHGMVELPLIGLIYLGFGQYFALHYVKVAVGLIGGLMLLWLGVSMFRARGRRDTTGVDLPYSSLAAGIITTVANPYFFLWWATIGAALVMKATAFGTMGVVLFALVHWLCDLAWDQFVSVVTFKSRRLWTRRVQQVVFGGCALILMGFGVWFIFSTFS